MSKRPTGRPNGRLLHADACEALIACRGLMKRTTAAAAGISPTFLADLLAHRAGASDDVVERLADALEVKPAALFPELAGWVGPLPDRDAKRGR
jgi:lambda repressor-like predicted transcriptional regulator